MADADRAQVAREMESRRRLLEASGNVIPRPPWLPEDQPPSAVDLIQFATWRAGNSGLDAADLLAALTLLPAARTEVDQLETALFLKARARGISWSRISRALGLRSPQAAQQRYGRVAGRIGLDPAGPASGLRIWR